MKRLEILAAVSILALLLSSCQFSRKISIRYAKSHIDTAASWCAKDFPCVLGEIISSDTIRKIDTTYLSGDSVLCPAGAPAVKCPPRLIIHDSTSIHDSIPVRDSAQIRILMGKLDSSRVALTQVSADRDRLKAGRNTWRSIAIPLIAALLAWVAAKFKLI